MKLRDHPLVKPHWPPQWTAFFGSRAPCAATGEIGTLEDIRAGYLSGRCCFLVIGYKGTSYLGQLDFGDDAFCRRFVDLLQQHRGESITQIAELDLS